MSAPRLDLVGPAGTLGSPIHRLDPRAKLIGLTSVTLVAVTTPLSAWPVYVACAAVLATVAATSGVGPRELWRRVRVVLPLVLLAAISIPFVRSGGDSWALGPLTVHEAGLAVLAATAAKAAIGTVAAAILAATTSFPSLLRGLERLRVPRLLVMIAGLTYRYLFVVAAEVQRMRQALAARSYRPRTALQAAPIGRVAGALFLRAHARGERVHLAMLARGYGGAVPRLDGLAFGRADAAFVALVLLALVPLRIAG